MNSSDQGKAIQRRLLLARKAAKYTQQEAADLVGRTRQWLSKCESEDGRHFPDALELATLCTAYGVQPGYVLFGVTNMAATIARFISAPPAPQEPLVEPVSAQRA